MTEPASDTGQEPPPVRVLVADDQALVRGGLIALLRGAPGVEPVGEACDGAQAVSLSQRHRPDVVLMDIRMPVMDGIAATREILAGPTPLPRIIVLTTFDLDEYVYSALGHGAAGFLLKDTPPARIVSAIHTVAAGDVLVAPEILRRLVESHALRHRTTAVVELAGLDLLTPRETEVLRLVAAGLSNAEVAAVLVVSEETVKTHLKRVMSKLHLTSRAQAVVAAYESGLVSAR